MKTSSGCALYALLWFLTGGLVAWILAEGFGIEYTSGALHVALLTFIFAAPLVLTAYIDARVSARRQGPQPESAAGGNDAGRANVALRILGVVGLSFAGIIVATAAVFVLPLFIAIAAVWGLGVASIASAVSSAVTGRSD